MTALGLAYRYGISYEDYLSMSEAEMEEAIHGVQIKENMLYSLLRILVWSVVAYLGIIKPKTSIEDFFPLPLDKEKPKKKGMTPEDEKEMEEVFRKRDENRKRKNALKHQKNGSANK